MNNVIKSYMYIYFMSVEHIELYRFTIGMLLAWHHILQYVYLRDSIVNYHKEWMHFTTRRASSTAWQFLWLFLHCFIAPQEAGYHSTPNSYIPL